MRYLVEFYDGIGNLKGSDESETYTLAKARADQWINTCQGRTSKIYEVGRLIETVQS